MTRRASVRAARGLVSLRRQNNIYNDLAATWVLRLVLAIQPERHILRTLTSDRKSQFLGVRDEFEDADGERLKQFTVREMKRGLNQRLAELGESNHDLQETPLGINIKWLSEKLNLGVAEQSLLAYAVLLDSLVQFRITLEALDFECSSDQLYEAFSSMLGVTSAKMRIALSAKSALIQSGLVKITESEFSIENRLEVPDNVCEVLMKRHSDVDSILRSFFREATPAKLGKEDFSHLSQDLELLTAYLLKVKNKKACGVNILLYGDPGVGKSEFARLIAKNIDQSLYEVASDDGHGNAIDGKNRFASFMLTQKMLAKSAGNIVLFDEIEDVFPSSVSNFIALFGEKDTCSAASLGKAWVNHLLETNPVPAIWITNSISDIDPAYLRRFDYTLEFPKPPKEARRRIAQKYLQPMKTSARFIERIASLESLTPAQIEKAAKVARIASNSPEEAELLTERALKHSAKLLGQPQISIKAGQSIGYDLAYLNTSIPTAALITGLNARPSGTFCLHGAPGTGKTAFARHLADSIGKPLLVKRASDLLSKWLGDSEQNIAKMFQEAQQEGAVLLLDEADSLLADRRGAHQSWEITQVNELLTQMEDFNGIFICTTNLLDRLDPASLRRFAFKIRFDCLNREQRQQLFNAELRRLAPGVKVISDNVITRLNRLDKLTPGDFSAVAKQWALWATQPSAEALITALEEECKVKGGSTKPMGFTS